MNIKRISKYLKYYGLIPFLASLPGFVLNLCGLSDANIAVVPLLAVLIYVLFRKKLDMELGAKVNGIAFLALLACFTLMMLISSGSIEGTIMANFCWFIFPFAPIMIVHMLMGQELLLFAAALLTYAASFAVCAVLGKLRVKRLWLPLILSAACIAGSTTLYMNRPAARYSGHGFDYMHGFSSTDFTDYTVYAENSKLVEPDSPVGLLIENEEDMPVLDGAEACYPLYAAFAKAVYKDIDKIELQWLKDAKDQSANGKIVTFTNTVMGFERLLRGGADEEKYGGRADMFFGARPSEMQKFSAKESGVELEITPIGREAFVFFVEADNPVQDLSSEQLKAIYHGAITNWKELGGMDREILAFQRPANSGSQTMMEYFMGELSLKEPQTYEMVDAMMGVVHKVAQYANDRGALGYSFRYFLEGLGQEEGVKMLSVDGVYPSPENIENGSYPLTTNVCLITRKDDPNPFVAKMKDFILSDVGQEIVRKTGYAGVGE